MSNSKFVNQGVILFIDLLIVGAGNWIFWLLVSKISTTSEVGQATSIISLVWMTTLLIQLGLEYPLLKFPDKSKLLATTLLIELIILLVALPVFLYSFNNIFPETSSEIIYITIAMMFLSLTAFVARFSLLGISKVKTVLIIDSVGTSVKFLSGYILVSMDLGLIGILVPFVLIHLVISSATIIIASRFFEFKIGNLAQVKSILKSGLSNAPSKLSRVTILTLVVVLLASFGIDDSDIGIFYIAMMISFLAAATFARSISYMVIPASTKLKIDLSSTSLRIGLGFTIPIIVALLVAPSEILSLVSQDYAKGGTVLSILAIGIFPFIIMLNAISKLNNLSRNKDLIVIGVTQVSAFFVTFFLLVNEYQTLGAAYSIVIGFLAGSIPSLIWLGRKTFRYLSFSLLALILGWGLGYFMNNTFEIPSVISLISSILISVAVIFSLKVISINDIKQVLKNSLQKN